MSAGECVIKGIRCVRSIDPDRDYRKVTGWERRREQGGTNAVRAREVHDEWACRFCVDDIAKGIGPDQGSLL